MRLRRSGLGTLGVALVLCVHCVPAAAVVSAGDPLHKVDPRVFDATSNGATASFVVLLDEQVDLAAANDIGDADARGWYVYRALRHHAQRTQRELRRRLRAAGVQYRSFWAANAVVVTGDRRLLEDLASRADVRVIESNQPRRWIEDPQLSDFRAAPRALQAVEWGVNSVNAPSVWALGFTGQGIVVGDQDTGSQWNHPALKSQYRGWDGSQADHNYSWHDAIHSGGGVCGANTIVPCDDDGHGTHTAGTAVGFDGGTNRIGVAPGARWIGCRNMDQGVGTPATYMECFQFFMAPTDLGGANPDPSRRPHVVNNSWGCPPSEGCAANTLKTVVENAEAAGIFVEASAGNSGPACGTVQDPPAIYAAAFSTAAYDVNNRLASFSSRGPVTVDASNRMKPDIAAPGVSVRSSLPMNGYGYLSGTSMAGPHVVGVVALLWSARPQLVRDVAATKALLRATANPSVLLTVPETCGGVSSTTTPNNSFGYGRVDALAALEAVPASTPTATATSSPTATATPSRSATVSATPTESPTPTPSVSSSVAGRIRYYSADLPVSGVGVGLSGGGSLSTVTDTDGQYQFAAVSFGDWTSTPLQRGNAASALTALDAVLVLQAAVGLTNLDANQRIAADANGDGGLSAIDASFILQLRVGLIAQLPVAQRCASDWAFVPQAPGQQEISPATTSTTCRHGAIQYTGLAADVGGQDFLGVAYGDVNGSWQAGGGGAGGTVSATTSDKLHWDDLRGHAGRARRGLYLDSVGPVYAIDAELTYDATRVRPVAVRRIAARGALLSFNVAEPGRVRIAAASAEPIVTGGRPALAVVFEPVR